MAVDTEPRAGLSLAVRIFFVVALVAALAVAGAVLLIHLLGERIATDAAERNLKRAAAIQEILSDQRLDQLLLRTQVAAGNPSFAAYLETSVSAGETLSLVDILEQTQGDLGADAMLLLDPDGRLIASTLEIVRGNVDLSGDPLIREALESFEAAGIWSRSNRIYEAVVVPAATAGILVGFIISGYEIGDAAVRELEDVTGADATVFVRSDSGPRLVASTLQVSEAEAVIEQIDRPSSAAVGWEGPIGTMMPPIEVVLDEAPSLAHSSPLWDNAGTPVGAVVITDSLAAQRAPFARLSQRLLWIGLGAILLSLPLSLLLARRISRPISELALAARAAAEGDYDQQVVTLERRDEIGTLSRAFDSLLSDLRERRDMEHYVAELGRSLPPAGSVPSPVAGTTLATPTTSMSTVLAVELPRGRRTASIEQATVNPTTMLDRESSDLRRAAGAVAAQGGHVDAVLGRRMLATFQGEDRATRALAAAAALHGASGTDKAPVIAVTSDVVVSGPVSLDGRRPRPMIAGPGADQAERLLSLADSGEVVVAQSMFADLDAQLRQSGRSLEEQPDFSSALPLFVLPGDLLTSLAGSAMDRTWPGTVQPAPDAHATQATLGPGHMIAGRYEILGTLGSGGMGIVHRAHDHELDEIVALKMLRPDMGIDETQLENMKLEIKLARKITHPNVLRTFDFGDHLGTPFISMEYVPGITLRQLLHRSDRLPLSAGLRLARQLCRGLEAAHAVGVLHRDIKPENLIVEPNGNAKLMDFGIARGVTEDRDATRQGGIVGTPVYLAPEQIRGEDPDVRADIYASGAVFYEVFTGSLAFDTAANVMEMLQRKLDEDPPPPSTKWPEIPATLETIIVRCLARDRNARFPSAAAVLTALQPLRA